MVLEKTIPGHDKLFVKVIERITKEDVKELLFD
jgi:hypothetical protein